MSNSNMLSRILAPLVSLFIFTLGNGFAVTLTTLRLHLGGSSSIAIGIISGAYYAGFILGSFNIEKSIARVGHIRVFAALASTISVASILQGIFVHPVFWLILRFVSGFATAGLLVVIESWLLINATLKNRGQILAFYMVALYGGLSLGQFFLNLANPASLLPFALIALLSSLAVIPLTISKITSPIFEKTSTLSWKKLYQLSASGVFGSLASGLILAATYSMLPLFIAEKSGHTSGVALVMAILIFGGTFLQYPVGRLSDIVERRSVLIGIVLLTAVTSFFILIGFNNFLLAYLLIFIFGGLTFTIYPVSLSHACDNLAREDIVAGTQGLSLAYSIGATLGPLLAPIFMQTLGSNGLFIYYIIISILAGAGLIWRRFAVRPKLQEKQFIPVPQTTPLIAELSPHRKTIREK